MVKPTWGVALFFTTKTRRHEEKEGEAPQVILPPSSLRLERKE